MAMHRVDLVERMDSMMEDYEASGGSFLELVREYRRDPNTLMFMARPHDITKEEMELIVEAIEAAIEDVKADLELDVDIDVAAVIDEADLPNSERWPDVLEGWIEEGGGTVEEFDILGLRELIALGVSPEDVAEELARELWREDSEPSFSELSEPQQEAIKEAAVTEARRRHAPKKVFLRW